MHARALLCIAVLNPALSSQVSSTALRQSARPSDFLYQVGLCQMLTSHLFISKFNRIFVSFCHILLDMGSRSNASGQGSTPWAQQVSATFVLLCDSPRCQVTLEGVVSGTWHHTWLRFLVCFSVNCHSLSDGAWSFKCIGLHRAIGSINQMSSLSTSEMHQVTRS